MKDEREFFILHPSSFILVLILLYALTLCWLSLERHAAHQTNALDLGYYSHTLWNTIHGSPFRFTTYHEAAFFLPEFDPNTIKQQDNLLAYHVEPILLPLSLLYLVWPDPRALLILQSILLASGAWPAFKIARRHLVNPWFALAFSAVYLMSPSLIGANLSDFHPVTLSAAFFLWAFDAFEQRAFRTFLLSTLLIIFSKEEMGLLVVLLGVYQVHSALRSLALPINRLGLQMALRYKRTVAALIAMLLGASWTVLAVLIQREAAGTQASLFIVRYSWLGHSIREMVQNALTTPALIEWLKQPDVYGYLGQLLAQVGFLALLAPEIMLPALPEIAINAFSRFDWMRSGVAHYSAPIVPFLVIAAIVGVQRMTNWLRRILDFRFPRKRSDWRRKTSNRCALYNVPQSILLAVPTLIALVFAAYQYHRAGQTPFTQDFTPYGVTAHDQKLSGVATRIPSHAKLSAQSDLYPHLSQRAAIYLFPTISDADYIALDVTGETYPVEPIEYARRVQQIINETPVGIVVADDGYLVLSKSEGKSAPLPEQFFSFTRADERNIQYRRQVRFGDSLEWLGYDFEILTPRQVPSPAANIRTFWRALRRITDEFHFVFHFYAANGQLIYTKTGSPTELWYPTQRWRIGETIGVEQRGVRVARNGKIGVSVEHGDEKTPLLEQPQAPTSDLIETGVLKLLDVR